MALYSRKSIDDSLGLWYLMVVKTLKLNRIHNEIIKKFKVK